jgi:hypothetical protein
MGSKIMRVDEEFLEEIKRAVEETGRSGIKITRQLAKKLKDKKKVEQEEWDFKV